MATRSKGRDSRLKKVLAGGLLKYAVLASLAGHLALWAWAAWPGDGDAASFGPGKPVTKTTVRVVRTITDLPPPPSLEPTAPTARAPRGLDTAGDVGRIPLPVPDEDADVNSWRPDDNVGNVDPNVHIIVDPNIKPPDPKDPWVEPNFTVDYSEPPVIIHQERPKYPELARAYGLEGDVVLFVYVDEEGCVRNAVVQASPGMPALDEAAREAAMKCTFRPARQQGKPVGVWYNIVMQFRQ